jgi:hypothetical protein
MNGKRIALIGYPAEYFVPFARALEESGFEVFWVCALSADAKCLRGKGFGDLRILDLNQGFKPGVVSLADCRQQLALFENDTDPKVNDIILMDRLLSQKKGDFAIDYLRHVAAEVSSFLLSREVDLVSSWRDTAVQLMAMLVSRHHGIPFVVPTRIRIPQEVYGFCTAHHTESFLTLGEPSVEDRTWAANMLESFESHRVRPALKKASRSFLDVLRLMPSHLMAFIYELRRSTSDLGNDYNRYPLLRLVKMYLRRRINLFRYKTSNPSIKVLGMDERFCLYALHTQPESSIDVQGSYFSNQIELIRHIVRSLPASHVLYVKVHPTDVDGKPYQFYEEIKAIPSVRLVDYSVESRGLMERADIIFALTGTIAYEAAMMQKSVVVFAKNFFNPLPTVHRCDAPTALPTLVSQLLSQQEIANDGNRLLILEFLARLRSSCFDGEVSRTYGASNEPLRGTDLSQIQKAYGRLFQALVDRPGL